MSLVRKFAPASLDPAMGSDHGLLKDIELAAGSRGAKDLVIMLDTQLPVVFAASCVKAGR
jgi:hypothetical protein